MGCDALEDGRGVAVADLNDDGRLDLVVSTNNGRPIIYMNNQTRAGNWLRVDLGGGRQGRGRDALGARVEVVVDHNDRPRTITRWVEAGAGYASQSEYTLHFGLGDARTVESLIVTWPGLPPRRFTKDELGEVLNETVSIDGEVARVRKRQPKVVTARQTRESVRGQ